VFVIPAMVLGSNNRRAHDVCPAPARVLL